MCEIKEFANKTLFADLGEQLAAFVSLRVEYGWFICLKIRWIIG